MDVSQSTCSIHSCIRLPLPKTGKALKKDLVSFSRLIHSTFQSRLLILTTNNSDPNNNNNEIEIRDRGATLHVNTRLLLEETLRHWRDRNDNSLTLLQVEASEAAAAAVERKRGSVGGDGSVATATEYSVVFTQNCNTNNNNNDDDSNGNYRQQQPATMAEDNFEVRT